MDVMVFEQLRYLSLEDMIAYVSGELPQETRKKIDCYLEDHPYEKQAIEGLAHLYCDKSAQSIPELISLLAQTQQQLNIHLSHQLKTYIFPLTCMISVLLPFF